MLFLSHFRNKMRAQRNTYSSTIPVNHPSSLAMAEYSSLYVLATDLACSKQLFGNKLGKIVTGAVVASATAGSCSVGTNVGAGLTARPFAIDQSFKFESR